jgi:hypothetical protein
LRWIKTPDKAPAWDEIPSVPPIFPEPEFKGPGSIGRAIADCFAKWTLNRKHRNEAIYINAMGDAFYIGTKCTAKNPAEAMKWYFAATGGNPAGPRGTARARPTWLTGSLKYGAQSSEFLETE